jgi:hypothetical protein
VSPGATFERVYRAIKAELGNGRYLAAEALEPHALALELSSSITPVRDALHRLVGERLVEAPQGDGFRTPAVTELGLRHLYRWNAALLLLASGGTHSAPLQVAQKGAGKGAGEAEHLFAVIAAGTGSPEHFGAILNLNDRLRPVRRVEAWLVPDWRGELGAMESAFELQGLPGLRRLITAYHRRRERLAPEIVAALQDRRPPPPPRH